MKLNFFSLEQDFSFSEEIVFSNDYFQKYNTATSSQIGNHFYDKMLFVLTIVS